MKPIYIIVFIVIFPFLSSCMKTKEHQRDYPIEVVTSNSTRPINELKGLVLKGDTLAYEEMLIGLMNDEYNECLLYSMVMANKYKYPRACLQVYFCLTLFLEQHDVQIDENTKALAIKYLKKGIELNDGQSMEELGNLYMKGKYVPKDTILGKKLYEKGRKRCGF